MLAVIRFVLPPTPLDYDAEAESQLDHKVAKARALARTRLYNQRSDDAKHLACRLRFLLKWVLAEGDLPVGQEYFKEESEMAKGVEDVYIALFLSLSLYSPLFAAFMGVDGVSVAVMAVVRLAFSEDAAMASGKLALRTAMAALESLSGGMEESVDASSASLTGGAFFGFKMTRPGMCMCDSVGEGVEWVHMNKHALWWWWWCWWLILLLLGVVVVVVVVRAKKKRGGSSPVFSSTSA